MHRQFLRSVRTGRPTPGQRRPNRYGRVAVIGAGFAGVVAARDLSVAGHSVVQLEARDRAGGRAFLGEAFGGSVGIPRATAAS
ncbi:NAD(P)-binding protein [Streptomyces sp. NPDC050161]|uniref:NAD(P)-binding protein n=1 Tax=Streptomyces sp. NPDC050161 TaxID=3365604 RepID=UPI0037BDF128